MPIRARASNSTLDERRTSLTVWSTWGTPSELMTRLLVVVALGVIVFGAQEPAYSPARPRSGKDPSIPGAAVSGGEVRVDGGVSAEGAVTRATPLRSAPPFTELVVSAVR